MQPDKPPARVAIIHDWLTFLAGSERVLEQILAIWPQADLFTLVDFMDADSRRFVEGRKITTSFLQKMPRAKKSYRSYLPLMPLAIEQFDLSSYDLIVSSSHAVAKGVITAPHQLHVSYVHSPIRYAWDLQHQYLTEAGLDKGLKSGIARLILHYIRLWDSRTANSVDTFVANSRFISRRIEKIYRRRSTVIYPPVDTDKFLLRADKEDFYLTASRLVPYKKISLIVEAFARMPDKKLVVIGDGTEMAKVRALAGANVTILGYQPFDVLNDYMQRARAFVFAAEEDFGIVPVEAQACGTPVIAYGRGGVLETVIGLDTDAPPTGVFFYKQTAAAIGDAIELFETNHRRFSPTVCRENALRFSPARFREEFKALVEAEVARQC